MFDVRFRPANWRLLLQFVTLTAPPIHAQLVAYDGFGEYAAGAQVESGADGTSGPGLNGGAGWDGAYDVNSTIKSKVLIEDRSATPVKYTTGGISLLGGNRALRFWNSANGSCALVRPLGTVFSAAAADTLWFSLLFRTATGGASPLANQDLFQIGFDDSAATNPRVSIGSSATQTLSFPATAAFFARSTTDSATSDFDESMPIAAATTYLLVGRIQANGGVYDTVSLFVNPSATDHPSLPSAEIVLNSGLTTLSHALIRTTNLDNGDAYVLDELHIGRDYRSVVQALSGALRVLPAIASGDAMTLRWPVANGGAILETSTSLGSGTWTAIPGPFPPNGAEWEFAVTIEPGTPQRFFRLRR